MDPPKQQETKKLQKTEQQKKEPVAKIEEGQNEQGEVDKTYIKSKKKWKDFPLNEHIIECLRSQNKNKPTKVQEEALEIALNPGRKKFNLLIRAVNGSGKTLAFLLPIIWALEPGLVTCMDKVVRGQTIANQIFKPQGVIIIQNFLLQSQLNTYLNEFKSYGQNHDVPSLKFTVGVLNNDGHKPGDIIVCMAKSFLNRYSRGNIKLDQCKFIAFDEIDEIYNYDPDTLRQLFSKLKEEKTNVIACSATMEKHFLNFYHEVDPDYIKLNLNAELEKETGQKITLEGVKNYSQTIECPTKGSKSQIYDFILKKIFKQLYGRKEVNKKPQLFVFFNSVDDIYEFDKKFQSLSGDFTTQESQYLQNLTRATIAAKVYKDGKKVDLPHDEKEMIMRKFRNCETNVLLCTNIMARGIDIRNAVFVINVGAPMKTGKDIDIDVDIYLHRVGRTGRHNDRGIALTLAPQEELEKLTDVVKKVHKIQIEKADSMTAVVDQVFKCIDSNA